MMPCFPGEFIRSFCSLVIADIFQARKFSDSAWHLLLCSFWLQLLRSYKGKISFLSCWDLSYQQVGLPLIFKDKQLNYISTKKEKEEEEEKEKKRKA